MVTIKINDESILAKEKLRFRIRLDFRAEEKNGRFLFGGKTSGDMAKAARNEQLELLKNVPIQGITFEYFDESMDIFFIHEESHKNKQEVAYAPLLVTIKADQIEDVFPLLLCPAFKKIEVLTPQNMNIERLELERLLYSIFRTFSKVRNYS